ncbi:MAG: hypothetical protein FWF59_13720 [Turicibacter sp.]|nr:hypothetical protein [Turicibacter sp.]
MKKCSMLKRVTEKTIRAQWLAGSLVLALLMALVSQPLTVVNAQQPSIGDFTEQSFGAKDLTEKNQFYLPHQEFDNLIESLEEHMTVSQEGFFFTQIPFYLYVEYGVDTIDRLLESALIVNELVVDGVLSINGDNTLAINDYEAFRGTLLNTGGNYAGGPGNTFKPQVRSRNVNRNSVVHWWGTRTYFNRATARVRIGTLQMVNQQAQAAAILSTIFMFPPGKVISNATRVVATDHVWAMDRGLNRTTHGIVVDINWALIMTVRSQ